MSLADAFAGAEAAHRNRVKSVTWGHLFPKGRRYKGTITVAHGVYGDVIVLNEEIAIAGSPWWKQAVDEFAWEMSDAMEPGTVRTFPVKVIVAPTKKAPEQIRITCLDVIK